MVYGIRNIATVTDLLHPDGRRQADCIDIKEASVKRTRREFVKLAVGAVAAAEQLPRLGAQTGGAAQGAEPKMEYRSRFLHVQMAADQPNIAVLSVDSLGQNHLDGNVMLPLPPVGQTYRASCTRSTVEYHLPGTTGDPTWSFNFTESGIVIRTTYSAGNRHEPLVFSFDSIGSHATLLGLFDDEGAISLPALLHFPVRGTFRITTNAPNVSLGYDASRRTEDFVRVSFPHATRRQPQIEYRLEVTCIYPRGANVDKYPRFDGYRRDFLSILQLNPRRRALANNSASDTCADTIFEYAMMAISMPPLAEGLCALDLIRQTLDRFIGGMAAYGMKEYRNTPMLACDFLDSYPSLVLAAAIYVQASHDEVWIKRNYSVIQSWAYKMIEADVDDDGLMEYPLSGNSGSWPEKYLVRPSNWWDTVGFGHKDAYANALACKAFEGMAELAADLGISADAALYKSRAEKLRAVYWSTFYNPETGVLAGWKSADGKLHDYYFLFVNGVAVTYGLVTPEQGNKIWSRLLAKMKEVGYNRFDLGLPGNLIPIRREDYVIAEKRWGGSQKADGSDGFQIYENGGASACFAYFTIRALQILGRNEDADAILQPMLMGFKDGRFQGSGPNETTYDWTAWDGSPHGYEGLLVDNYLTLLAAMPSHGKEQ